MVLHEAFETIEKTMRRYAVFIPFFFFFIGRLRGFVRETKTIFFPHFSLHRAIVHFGTRLYTAFDTYT